MNLNGSLDAFGLPDVFALLAMTGKSGGLRLHGTAVERPVEGVVWFHDGRVTGASANCAREGLVRRLVGSGVVDDAALSTAVARAGTSPVGVARALLEAGAVEPELVREAAVDQAVDAVFDLSRWDSGEFGFEQGTRNIDDVGIALEHTWLVAEATARSAAWDGLLEVIPGVDTLVALPVVLAADPEVTREEWALLALVDGRRTVADLVELTGCGVFAVVTVLAGLARRGLLAVVEPGGADHVATVRRRLAVLASAETVAPPVVEAPAAEPAPGVEAPAAESLPIAAGGLSGSDALAAARAAQHLAAPQPRTPGADRGSERPAARREAERPPPAARSYRRGPSRSCPAGARTIPSSRR